MSNVFTSIRLEKCNSSKRAGLYVYSGQEVSFYPNNMTRTCPSDYNPVGLRATSWKWKFQDNAIRPARLFFAIFFGDFGT